MKKLLWMVMAVIVCMQLAGCASWVVRTSTSRQSRVDQEITGNRGFIAGKPKSAPPKPTFTDRKVYRVEVELPELRLKKRSASGDKKQEDKTIWGNKGYIYSATKQERALQSPAITPQPIEEKPAALQGHAYRVRKGDTLQKISKQFYGTTKKWYMIYKVNREVLKSPDKVYPGQNLLIPEIGEFKK